MATTFFCFWWLAVPGMVLLARPAAAQQFELNSVPVAPAPAPTPGAPSPKLTSLPAAAQYRLTAITIDDARPLTSSRAIKLPAFSRPGQMDKVWPVLTPEQRAGIQRVVQAPFSADSTKPAVTLRCQLDDAYQTFFATTEDENVAAGARVTLELLDAQGDLLMAATGQQRLTRRSLDARHNVLDELYQQALLSAVRHGLLQLVMTAAAE
ncbi:hypothetical protein [Hymenobacter jeollabukensis]|uniref:ABC-type transport auxiliary lipoprotein component domain-containing protein n=1 Tax=Hymenobacter jeollabukensis TaxID=2025313 RepID=A0A5R8WNV9_9BACT|nr:hypothetical protein [Hymenobacter jeollabukensis]TLM91111.1 hypothetical protein FDY95_16070 [Hymenobacter jeollabukensis]